MTYILPALDYSYDALEPHIDAKTMEIHHAKHHQAYIDKLNAAVGNTDWAEKPLEELLQSIDILPSEIKGAVKNHGGGHWNHSFFWKCLTPGWTTASSHLEKIIKESFGSMDALKDRFFASAMSVFGSGWTWLVKDRDELIIKNTANQDNPLMLGEKAILGIDLWEHAYYLKNQNRRAEYLENIWNVIDRKQVEEHFNAKR
jgi:superoxide dismutase, Fe-Mn family